jgi:predicted transposase/invertase (TIGR01784 family)
MNENIRQLGQLSDVQLHDKFFKITFGMKDSVRDYLIHFFKKEIVSQLDLDSLTPETTEFISPKMTAYFADVLWQCKLKNGEDINIAFLFEHKSYPEKYHHVQILRYMVEIWENCIANNLPLTPIVPIIVYHGEAAWHYKPFESLFPNLPIEFKAFLPCFHYHLTDLKDYSKDMLIHLEAGVLVNAFMMMKHYKDKDFLKNCVEYIFHGAENFWDDESKRKFKEALLVYFIKMSELRREDLVNFIEPKLIESLKKEAMSTWDNLIAEGKAQGIDLGIEKITIRQFQKEKSLVEIADIVGLSIEKVKEIIEKYKKSLGQN